MVLNIHYSSHHSYCEFITFKLMNFVIVESRTLSDIKYEIANTHAIEPHVWISSAQLNGFSFKNYVFTIWDDFQAFVEFVGTHSKEWAPEYMKDLSLFTLRGNFQIIVQGNVLWPLCCFHKIFLFQLYCLFGYFKRINFTGTCRFRAVGCWCMHQTLSPIQLIWRIILFLGCIFKFKVFLKLFL